MHTGVVKKVIIDKGFGFIADTDGNEVFFHKNNLNDIDFSTLVGDEKVQFEIQKTPKGYLKEKINTST